MYVEEKRFFLKDGREAVLRSPREEDAEGMLECLVATAGETDFLIRDPEECAKYTVEFERKFLKDMAENENIAMLVCLVEGRIAGYCKIQFHTAIKTQHRATIGIALMKEYWNLGIGTRLFEEMLSITKKREHLLQLELQFTEGNDRGRHLYEKMGFRIAGVHPDALRLKDGTLKNEYLMIREL
ncbi:MAG: GNAT family N-acetyltransferase [Christensenellales bacterium]|jgi:RimJ/RimL family protein N-acetyltransferase